MLAMYLHVSSANHAIACGRAKLFVAAPRCILQELVRSARFCSPTFSALISEIFIFAVNITTVLFATCC